MMKVEIWSDVVCAWCAIGRRRFEEALSRFAHHDAVEVQWRAFELDPSATSTPAGQPIASNAHAVRLATKIGIPVEQAEQIHGDVARLAEIEGLALRFDLTVPANTAAAHQVIHLAALRGVQGAVAERLVQGHWTEGEAIGDPEVLVRLASEGGLAPEEVRAALTEDRYLDAVRSDEAEAVALGASGVPFYVIDRRYGVSGAQSAEQYLALLERVWEETHPTTLITNTAEKTKTGMCGPDNCSI